MNDNFNRRESESQLADDLVDSETVDEERLIEASLDEAENVDAQESTTGEVVDDEENARGIENESPQLESKDHENGEDDAANLINGDETASQLSEDQDESTIRNNENYEYNNDSAYETNGLNSQNGSNSRLQSADTNDEDVDNETGENFLLQAQAKTEKEIVELMKEDAQIEEMENFEIEKFENDLVNPPTPTPSDDDNDVILRAENPIETGDSTSASNGGLDGNVATYEEVHDFHSIT